MKNRLRLALCGFCWCVFFCGMVNFCYSQSRNNDIWSLAPVGGRIRGFELPLFNDDGIETGVIRGREAFILDRFRVRIEDLIYESSSEIKEPVFLRITQGVYNRESNALTSEGPVVLIRGEMEISGKGVFWDIQQQKGAILENARVVIFSESHKSPKAVAEKND